MMDSHISDFDHFQSPDDLLCRWFQVCYTSIINKWIIFISQFLLKTTTTAELAWTRMTKKTSEKSLFLLCSSQWTHSVTGCQICLKTHVETNVQLWTSELQTESTLHNVTSYKCPTSMQPLPQVSCSDLYCSPHLDLTSITDSDSAATVFAVIALQVLQVIKA